MPANLENSAVATGLTKVSLHSNHKEGQSQRMFNHTVVLISHGSKVMVKILQELPDVHSGFRKAEEPEIKLPNSTGS